MLVFNSQTCGPCPLFVVSVLRLADGLNLIGGGNCCNVNKLNVFLCVQVSFSKP